jgi:hypothetical protein
MCVCVRTCVCVCARARARASYCKKFYRIKHSVTLFFIYCMALSVSQAVYCQTADLLTNWKGFKSGHVLVTVPSQHLPGGTEVHHEKTWPWWLLPMTRFKPDIDTLTCLYIMWRFFLFYSVSTVEVNYTVPNELIRWMRMIRVTNKWKQL